MKKKKTQLLGIVLSAAMLATSVPAPVYAEPTDNVAEEEGRQQCRSCSGNNR